MDISLENTAIKKKERKYSYRPALTMSTNKHSGGRGGGSEAKQKGKEAKNIVTPNA